MLIISLFSLLFFSPSFCLFSPSVALISHQQSNAPVAFKLPKRENNVTIPFLQAVLLEHPPTAL